MGAAVHPQHPREAGRGDRRVRRAAPRRRVQRSIWSMGTRGTARRAGCGRRGAVSWRVAGVASAGLGGRSGGAGRASGVGPVGPVVLAPVRVGRVAQ